MITVFQSERSAAPPSGGTLIAVGGNNELAMLRSTDGAAAVWTDVTPSLTPNNFSWLMNDIVYDTVNSVWVAVGYGPAVTDGVLRSVNDGVTWSTVSMPVALNTNLYSIVQASPGVLLCCDQTQIFKSTNGGATWSQIAHGVSLGGGESIRNLATDGAGTVVAALQSTYGRYAISSNNGDTWADFNTGIGTRNPQRVSYANGQYIIAYSLPNISYSATGANGSWTHPTAFTSFTGSTGDYVWDGTRYWGMSPDHLGHYIQTALTDNPTINATVPPGLITYGFIYALGMMIFVTDFPAIRTTSGGTYTATTNQTIPDVGGSGYTFELYAIAYRPAA